jgi:hypothetical protein
MDEFKRINVLASLSNFPLCRKVAQDARRLPNLNGQAQFYLESVNQVLERLISFTVFYQALEIQPDIGEMSPYMIDHKAFIDVPIMVN